MLTKIDEQTLLAELPNLKAHVNRDLFFEKFIAVIEPGDESELEATEQSEYVRAEATKYLVDRNAGLMPIELTKADRHYCTVYQNLNDGDIYPNEYGGNRLPKQVKDKLIEEGAAIDNVDDKDSYHALAGLEIDGFVDNKVNDDYDLN